MEFRAWTATAAAILVSGCVGSSDPSASTIPHEGGQEAPGDVLASWMVSSENLDLGRQVAVWVAATAVSETTCEEAYDATGIWQAESVGLIVRSETRGQDHSSLGELLVVRGTGVQAAGYSSDAAFAASPLGWEASGSSGATLEAGESSLWLIAATDLDDPDVSLRFEWRCEGEFRLDHAWMTHKFTAAQPGSGAGGIGTVLGDSTASVAESWAVDVQSHSGSVHYGLLAHPSAASWSQGGAEARTPGGDWLSWRPQGDHPYFDATGGPGVYEIQLTFVGTMGYAAYVLLADWQTDLAAA